MILRGLPRRDFIISPAINYFKVVIPVEAGIQKTLDTGSSPA